MRITIMRNARRGAITGALVLCGAAASHSAHAATIQVNSLGDASNGSCATTCTLRDALLTAMAGDVVQLPGNGLVMITQGDLQSPRDVTVRGAATGTTGVDANNTSRIFRVNAGTLRLQHLTLTRGLATQDASGSVSASGGVALVQAGAHLVLDGVQVRNSGAVGAAGAVTANGTGGMGGGTNGAPGAAYAAAAGMAGGFGGGGGGGSGGNAVGSVGGAGGFGGGGGGGGGSLVQSAGGAGGTGGGAGGVGKTSEAFGGGGGGAGLGGAFYVEAGASLVVHQSDFDLIQVVGGAGGAGNGGGGGGGGGAALGALAFTLGNVCFLPGNTLGDIQAVGGAGGASDPGSEGVAGEGLEGNAGPGVYVGPGGSGDCTMGVTMPELSVTTRSVEQPVLVQGIAMVEGYPSSGGVVVVQLKNPAGQLLGAPVELAAGPGGLVSGILTVPAAAQVGAYAVMASFDAQQAPSQQVSVIHVKAPAVLVATGTEGASEYCAGGATLIYSGQDDGQPGGIEGNGVLEEGERDGTQRACNGTNGGDGNNTLIKVTALMQGDANCANGGQKLESGLDTGDGDGGNPDGVLNPSEVTTTQYLCSSTAGGGGTHNSVSRITQLNAGTACAAGGQRVEVGLDDGAGGGTADNGTLEDGEVDSTGTVCAGAAGSAGQNGVNGTNGTNGTNGFNSVTRTSMVATGDTQCPNGGQKVEAGADSGINGGTARDGILQDGEVQTSTVVCNGNKGADGEGATAASGCSSTQAPSLGLLAFLGLLLRRRRTQR